MHPRNFFRLMFPEPTATGGSTPPATPPADPTPPPATPPADPEVPDRIKRDMLKYKEEADALKKQLEDIKIRGHKEKEDWKSVAEHHETKAKEFEQKFTGLQSALVNDRKIAALTTEAVKQGINPASLPDLELLDFEEVQVETTSTGKILVTGQDRAIAKLKTLRPHWFSTSVPGINSGSPTVKPAPGGMVTIADLNAAEAQWQKTKSESDKKAYYDLIQRYKSQ